jgi:hypothetical protein
MLRGQVSLSLDPSSSYSGVFRAGVLWEQNRISRGQNQLGRPLCDCGHWLCRPLCLARKWWQVSVEISHRTIPEPSCVASKKS